MEGWMELHGIMLNEMSDRERQILSDLTYMWNLKKQNSRKSREGWWLLGAGWGGGNEKLVKVYKLPIMSESWGPDVQRDDYSQLHFTVYT